MDRKKFIQAAGLSATALVFQSHAMKSARSIKPESFFFKDDGIIPNNKLPLLVYHDVFTQRGDKGAEWLEERFAANSWTNNWRWGVYPFHHYHSNTHEVLGVFSGTALLHLGGEKGEKVNVKPGDIIVIPAGVGHKCISHSEDFTVVGAYPNGLHPDLKRGEKGDRPQTDKNIAEVAVPATDPLLGKNAGAVEIWK
jgi:uncharacterized protein YjlB